MVYPPIKDKASKTRSGARVDPRPDVRDLVGDWDEQEASA